MTLLCVVCLDTQNPTDSSREGVREATSVVAGYSVCGKHRPHLERSDAYERVLHRVHTEDITVCRTCSTKLEFPGMSHCVDHDPRGRILATANLLAIRAFVRSLETATPDRKST